MLRLRDFSKCLALCPFLGLVVFAWAATGTAQQQGKYPAAAPARSIILPARLVAGETATLAVLDPQGRLLSGAAVELIGVQTITTDSTGRALFKVPANPGKLVARVPHLVAATAEIVSPPGSDANASRPAPNAGAAAKVSSFPHLISVRDQFALEGSGFSGAADSNRVFLDGKLCLVLASSPVSLVVLPPPQVPVGQVELRVRVKDREAGAAEVFAVLLQISGPAEPASAGATGQLLLRAYGTSDPVPAEIRNSSPKVIQLLNGNVQQVMTSGGDDNVAHLDMRYVSAGNYAVSVRLISEPSPSNRSNASAKYHVGN